MYFKPMTNVGAWWRCCRSVCQCPKVHILFKLWPNFNTHNFYVMWMGVRNGTNIRGNSIYQWNEVRLLLANFCHIMANYEKPFIFPSQAQQVFFVDKDHNSQWKVILRHDFQHFCNTFFQWSFHLCVCVYFIHR
jgi:hypothetical protein